VIFAADDAAGHGPRPTALFGAAAGAAAANSWTSVNGWSAARVYTNVAEEYEAAHTGVAIVDAGPIVRYTARGRQAAELLARAATAPAAALEPGESARGLLLDQAGNVVDLVETARIASDLFLLSCSKSHARRLQLAARGLDAVIEDITGHVAALALLGPKARDAAAAAGLDVTNEALAVQTRVRGVETSARPLSFGALQGVEVILPFEEALTLWERLRRAARPKPLGLDALDVIRIEGGVPRIGVDFIGADDARREEDKRTPAALGLAHLAPPTRAWFNGRRGLRSQLAPSRRLTVLAIDAARVAPGAAVFGLKGEIGRLTSAAFSPHLKRMAAFAEIATGTEKVEVALLDGGRAAAEPLETAEGRRAEAFRASDGRATESRF